ncbi:unnamed protein product, partial [Prorocentrum cordatum]
SRRRRRPRGRRRRVAPRRLHGGGMGAPALHAPGRHGGAVHDDVRVDEPVQAAVGRGARGLRPERRQEGTAAVHQPRSL